MVIAGFENPDRQQEDERDRIGQNDRCGPLSQAVDQPQHRATEKGDEHAPGKIMASLASPCFVHLRHKG